MDPVIFFFLSPLFYSIDGDPFRAYEVVTVALIIFLLFNQRIIFKTKAYDIVVVLLFSIFLLFQCLYLIDDGSLFLGLKFFTVTIAAFFPFWLLRSVHWRYENLEITLERCVKLLFWITTVSIFSSFFLGIGERHNLGILGYRAFGFLGDSFSPVVVFLLLFFAFQGSKFHTLTCVLILLMMEAKAAIIMAVVSFALYFLVYRTDRVRNVTLSLLGFLFLLPFISLLPIGFESVSNIVPNVEYTLANRSISYALGVQYFLDNPIFGIGINQGLDRVYEDSTFYAQSELIDSYYAVFQVHNAYLRILSETGLIGFSLMMLLVIFWIKNALKSLKISNSIPKSSTQSMIFASSIYVIVFLVSYQTTGWFIGGHPQLTWLLMFSTLSMILADRKRKAIVQVQ